MEYKYGNVSEDKAAMAGQPNPPPYQEGSSMGHSQPGQQFAGYPQQPYPQPYPGQPFTGQPYPGQPFTGQPYPGQPFTGQPYPGQPYPGEVHVGQTVITLQPQAPLSPPENDYLGYSIFTLLCCCLPLGIAALVYSIFTRQANSGGNRGEAERSSRCARTLNHTALGLGLVVIILYIVYVYVILK